MTVTAIRYTPSGLNQEFSEGQLPFSAYVLKTREMISRARVDLSSPQAEKIIEANTPFEWHPTPSRAIIGQSGKLKYGILLIHGLLDSPFAMRELAQHFQNLGFLVRSILLPGHGTRPGDLLDISHQAWIDAAQYGIDSFKPEVENLYLLGLSAGANLSIYHALDDPFIRGLILFSPLIKLKNKFSFMANWFRTLGKFHSQANWYRLADDKDYAKYESLPYNIPYQASLLGKILEKKLSQKKISIPVFMALSQDDETINSEAAKDFFLEQSHPANKLVLYSSYPNALDDPHVEYRSSHFPGQNIINFSHVCLHASPENPHYGRKGDYLARLHLNKNVKQAEENIVNGALNPESMKNFSMRRLTYNPDHQGLLEILDNFLLKIA